MSSLANTAYYSRLGVKYGVIALAAIMVGRIVFGAVITYWKATHPAPPPAPTVGFGVLPDIEFPSQDKPQLTYTLQTPNGKFSDFGDRAKVFLMPVERPNLLALDRSVDQAAELNFKSQPTKLSDTLYRWNNTVPLPQTLEIYIYTGQFSYNVNWQTDPAFLSVRKLPAEPDAIAEAKAYLKRANLAPEDLNKGEAIITYLKSGGGDLIKTVSLSEADFLQTDLFRAVIDDKYQVVTADPTQGIVRTIFSSNQNAKIVSIAYNYFPVDYTAVETYPIKTPAVAWQELQAGSGYIAGKDKDVTAITVRRVELGYFDSLKPQHYLQPIYMFKGDNNFVAYVPAVRPASQKFIESQQKTTTK